MRKMDVNEQMIIYVIYNGEGKWLISDKEIWYFDYKKKIQECEKRGYEIKEEWIDARRRDLLYIDNNNYLLFLKRVEVDICSTEDLHNLFFINQEDVDYKPSLYVDFDKKIFYSIYSEPASYENYAPIGWISKYEDFFELIPIEQQYWNN